MATANDIYYQTLFSEWDDPARAGKSVEGVRVAAAEMPALMKGARRNIPPPEALTAAISYTLDRTYGPGYSFKVRSGIVDEPRGKSGASSSGRHILDAAGAADVQIYDPDGNQMHGASLTPFAQNWVSNFGSIGINAKASDTLPVGWTHVDFQMRQGRGQGPVWSYGGFAKGQKAAIVPYVGKGTWLDGKPSDDAAKGLMAAATSLRETTIRKADPNKLASMWRPGVTYDKPAQAMTPGPDGETVAVPATAANTTNAATALTATDRDAVIRTVIGEAISEGDDGMAAVAHVIRNRSTAGMGPTIAAIATDPSQFDAWNHGLVTAYGPGSVEYERTGKVVDAVFSGELEDKTKGATYFYSGDKAPGFWKGAVNEVVTIGRHVFGAPVAAVKAVAAAIKPTPRDPNAAYLERDKRLAFRPETVALQTRLAAKGLYNGDIDGKFGRQTENAVRAWQRGQKLTNDGIAGPMTLQSLGLPTLKVDLAAKGTVNPETPANRARLFPETGAEQLIADAAGVPIPRPRPERGAGVPNPPQRPFRGAPLIPVERGPDLPNIGPVPIPRTNPRNIATAERQAAIDEALDQARFAGTMTAGGRRLDTADKRLMWANRDLARTKTALAADAAGAPGPTGERATAADFVQSVVDAARRKDISPAPSASPAAATAAGRVRTVNRPAEVTLDDILGAVLPSENLLTDMGVYTPPAKAATAPARTRPAPAAGTPPISPEASAAVRSRTPGYPYEAPAAAPARVAPMGRATIPADAIQVASADDDYWPGIGATELVPGTGKPTPATENYLSTSGSLSGTKPAEAALLTGPEMLRGGTTDPQTMIARRYVETGVPPPEPAPDEDYATSVLAGTALAAEEANRSRAAAEEQQRAAEISRQTAQRAAQDRSTASSIFNAVSSGVTPGGRSYVVGTGPQGQRAIQGNGWTAYQNDDNTWSYSYD